MCEHTVVTDRPAYDTAADGGVIMLIGLAIAGAVTGWFGTAMLLTELTGALTVVVVAVIVGILAAKGRAPLPLVLRV